MTGQSRTTTSIRKELCTWNCICVVKLSWRTKPSRWTVRRPIPMTTWKPRSTQSTWNPTMTWHTWWTRECARAVVSLRSLVLSHSFLWHIAWLKMFACLCHLIHAWSERFLWLPWSLHDLQLPSLIPHQPQAVPATLQLPRGQVVSHCKLRQGDGVNSRVLLQHRLWAQWLLHHGDLCRVHDRATVPRATVPRGRGLRRCHNRGDALQCTPRTSLSLPARRLVCWSVVVVRVR